MGEQHGHNPFHSFAPFGIGKGETATFTGPDPADGPQSVSNVISRVTGVEPSGHRLGIPTKGSPGRELEVVTDMTNSRLAGFHEYQPTLGSFLDSFARLRRERIIPSW
jgi:hypothetical protein